MKGKRLPEEILIGNKLIAFSEFASNATRGLVDHAKSNDVDLSNVMSYLSYHREWKFLMPVVLRIESLKFGEYTGFSVTIKNEYCLIECRYSDRQDGCIYQTAWGSNPKSKIESVWHGVVAFIKWYNENNPK